MDVNRAVIIDNIKMIDKNRESIPLIVIDDEKMNLLKLAMPTEPIGPIIFESKIPIHRKRRHTNKTPKKKKRK